MNTTGCYYKLVVLQVDWLETTIFTEMHFGTMKDAEQAAATYNKHGFVPILLRMWQNSTGVIV